MKKFYITTPIYYANDKPHIGSAYPTIASDVLARYHRLKGEEVFFLTGTDEHGNKVAKTAEENNLSPKEFTDQISASFMLAWDILDISQDHFIRTTSIEHKNGVEKVLNKMKEAGAIYEGEYLGLYCNGCESFVTEKELIDGLCPVHKVRPEEVREKNYFFNLKKYLPELERKIIEDEIRIMPESKKKEVIGLFKQGMEDFSISRESVKWGIKLPFDEKQVTYVWVDALSNYITGLGYGSNDESRLEKFWPADIHVIGKDILKFHAVYWPAMLMAIGIETPKVVFAHGFFTVDGQKMGKSLGNIIDPTELVKEFGSDAVRYLLLAQFPFGQDGDFKAGDFVLQYNADLANGVGNLSSRVLAMTEKYFNGEVPEKDHELEVSVKDIWRDYEAAAEIFAVDKMILAIKSLVSLGDGYVEKNKPWELAKTDPDRLAKVIYNLLELLRHLGLMIYPVMPQAAEKLLANLAWADEYKNQNLEASMAWGGLETKAKVEKGEGLFPRIS